MNITTNTYVLPKQWENEEHKQKFFYSVFKDMQMNWEEYHFGDDMDEKKQNELKAQYFDRLNEIKHMFYGMIHDCPPSRYQQLIDTIWSNALEHLAYAIDNYRDDKIRYHFFITTVEYTFRMLGVKFSS